MKYLKSANNGSKGFSAKFTNGESSTSYDAASFFMVMQDKGAQADELAAYIRLGSMVEPQKDWKEIKRIADTFQSN